MRRRLCFLAKKKSTICPHAAEVKRRHSGLDPESSVHAENKMRFFNMLCRHWLLAFAEMTDVLLHLAALPFALLGIDSFLRPDLLK